MINPNLFPVHEDVTPRLTSADESLRSLLGGPFGREYPRRTDRSDTRIVLRSYLYFFCKF